MMFITVRYLDPVAGRPKEQQGRKMFSSHGFQWHKGNKLHGACLKNISPITIIQVNTDHSDFHLLIYCRVFLGSLATTKLKPTTRFLLYKSYLAAVC